MKSVCLSVALLAVSFSAALAEDEITLESVPPVVVKTVPEAGASDVDAALTEIKVTYSKAMMDGSWSWSTASKESFPTMNGQPKYLEDKRTCVLPVKLEPGKTYAIWLNSSKFKNFKDADGRPAVPYLLVFKTGPDGGKDLLVVEEIAGKIGRYRLKWVVSCKHFATSNRAVNEADEINIIERVQHFAADGFIGFYSTVASCGLNSRLHALRENRSIRDYRIYDHKAIENVLVTVGFSHLMMRYLPASYTVVKPLHLVGDSYSPLACEICQKDLLTESFHESHAGNIIYAYRYDESHIKPTLYEGVYVACKTPCDERLAHRLKGLGLMTSWKDIGDLLIPVEYLRFVFAVMNRIRGKDDEYTDSAYKQEIDILCSIAQKVLRHTTERERNRYLELLQLWPF
jgi:hypothetical protein